MNFSAIEVTVDGARAGITLKRPDKLNPLSTATLNDWWKRRASSTLGPA